MIMAGGYGGPRGGGSGNGFGRDDRGEGYNANAASHNGGGRERGSYYGGGRDNRDKNNNGYNGYGSHQRGGQGGSSGDRGGGGSGGRSHNWGGRSRGGNYANNNNNNNNNSGSRYRNRDRDGRSDRNERGSNNTPYATSEDVQFVKVLKGYHSKQISSVVLDQNSGQLFTASKDGKVCVWDTRSGDFSSEVFVGAEIDSMLLISGGWLFVGINVREGCSIIRAYNMGTSAQQDMEGHTGQIYSLTANDMYLFSASQDKTIRVWKYDEATGNFGCVGVLSGHTGPVISLTIAGDYLFSASYDLTIRVWSLTSAACVQIIENAHKEAILSLLIWEGHLLSCSLDGDVKVWAPGTNNVLEVNSMFTYPEPRDKDSQSGNRTRNRSYNRTPRKFKDGALMLCGSLDMNTPVPRPVLMVAYNNGVVGLWDLPSFADRGELRFPRSWESAPIRALAVGPEGLMFTGDSKGQVCVWNWQKTQDAT